MHTGTVLGVAGMGLGWSLAGREGHTLSTLGAVKGGTARKEAWRPGRELGPCPGCGVPGRLVEGCLAGITVGQAGAWLRGNPALREGVDRAWHVVRAGGGKQAI